MKKYLSPRIDISFVSTTDIMIASASQFDVENAEENEKVILSELF